MFFKLQSNDGFPQTLANQGFAGIEKIVCTYLTQWDDLGRVVIPKEIRRTMRIREGDPLQTTLEWWERFCFGMMALSKRMGWSGT